MSNFKGTKGKWDISSTNQDQIESQDGINICDCWSMGDNRFPDELEMKANALLISKAPEMLEVLENIENDNGSIPAFIWEWIQKVIKSATEL